MKIEIVLFFLSFLIVVFFIIKNELPFQYIREDIILKIPQVRVET